MKKRTLLALLLSAFVVASPVNNTFASEESNKEKEWENAWNEIGNGNKPAEEKEEEENNKPEEKGEISKITDDNEGGNAWEKEINKKHSNDKVDPTTFNPYLKEAEDFLTKADAEIKAKLTEGTQAWLKIANKKLEKAKEYRAELNQSLKDFKDDAWYVEATKALIEKYDTIIKDLEMSIEKEEYFHWTGAGIDMNNPETKNGLTEEQNKKNEETKEEKTETKVAEVKKVESKKSDSKSTMPKTAIASTSLVAMAVSALGAVALKKRNK